MAEISSVSQPLEVDTDSDHESTYAESFASSTDSLTSSVVDYVYENGRRYHRYQEGKYMLPNDETEQDRLDLYHHMQLLSLGGNLHLAPISKTPQRILDCGTGTGIWALDAGVVYPSAEVIGVDLSAIQPEWVVPNVRFEVDDLEMEWTFRLDHFDFIHSRNLAQSIKDWPKFLRQMYKHTKPGGYIELSEADTKLYCDDGTLSGTELEKIFGQFQRSLEMAGLTLTDGDTLKRYVEEAGFQEVKVYKVKQAWGGWPKDREMKKIGHVLALTLAAGLESYAMAPLTRFLGIKPEVIRASCAASNIEVNSRKVHAYQITFQVVGRKPE